MNQAQNGDKERIQQSIVRKHSAAVHISNAIGAVERKIFNILLMYAKEGEDVHSVSVKQLLHDLDWGIKSRYNENLVQNLDNLMSTKVFWNILGQDKKSRWRGGAPMLAGYEIVNGILTFSYSAHLRGNVHRPNIYANLNLEEQKKLKDKYAISLWELFNNELDSRKKNDTSLYVENKDLRELMGVFSSSYENFKRFHYAALRPNIDKINESTNISVQYTLHREGRKVVGVVFHINRQPKHKQMALNIEESPPEIDKNDSRIHRLYEKLEALCLEKEQLSDYYPRWNLEEIDEACDVALRMATSDAVIKNAAGYIWSLLTKGVKKRIGSNEIKQAKALREKKEINYLLREISVNMENEKDKIKRQILLTLVQECLPEEILYIGKKYKEIDYFWDKINNKEVHVYVPRLGIRKMQTIYQWTIDKIGALARGRNITGVLDVFYYSNEENFRKRKSAVISKCIRIVE